MSWVDISILFNNMIFNPNMHVTSTYLYFSTSLCTLTHFLPLNLPNFNLTTEQLLIGQLSIPRLHQQGNNVMPFTLVTLCLVC